jgi:hypothetical protein
MRPARVRRRSLRAREGLIIDNVAQRIIGLQVSARLAARNSIYVTAEVSREVGRDGSS